MAGPESGRSGRGASNRLGARDGRTRVLRVLSLAGLAGGQILGWESQMARPEFGRSGRGSCIRLGARNGRTRV